MVEPYSVFSDFMSVLFNFRGAKSGNDIFEDVFCSDCKKTRYDSRRPNYMGFTIRKLDEDA